MNFAIISLQVISDISDDGNDAADDNIADGRTGKREPKNHPKA